MSDYDTIQNETWKILIPNDWAERECRAGNTVYFESSDHTKGAYFSTWCFQDDARSAQEILESFRHVELKNLYEMKDSFWESVNQWNHSAAGLNILGEDFLDRQANYRIVCHLVCHLPWLVRSSFHDYACTDYEASRRFFQPIIKSLEIHDCEPGTLEHE